MSRLTKRAHVDVLADPNWSTLQAAVNTYDLSLYTLVDWCLYDCPALGKRLTSKRVVGVEGSGRARPRRLIFVPHLEQAIARSMWTQPQGKKSIGQVAKELGKTRQIVYRWCNKGTPDGSLPKIVTSWGPVIGPRGGKSLGRLMSESDANRLISYYSSLRDEVYRDEEGTWLPYKVARKRNENATRGILDAYRNKPHWDLGWRILRAKLFPRRPGKRGRKWPMICCWHAEDVAKLGPAVRFRIGFQYQPPVEAGTGATSHKRKRQGRPVGSFNKARAERKAQMLDAYRLDQQRPSEQRLYESIKALAEAFGFNRPEVSTWLKAAGLRAYQKLPQSGPYEL